MLLGPIPAVGLYDPKYSSIGVVRGKGYLMAWSRIVIRLSSLIPSKLQILFLFVNHSTLAQLCHGQLLLLSGPSEGFTGHTACAKWIVGWMIATQIRSLPCGGTKHNCYYYVRSLSQHHAK